MKPKAKGKPTPGRAAPRRVAPKKRAAPPHVGGANPLVAGPPVAGDVKLPPETVKPNPEIPPMTMRDQRIFTEPTRYYPPQAQVQAGPTGFGQDRSPTMAKKKLPPWMQSAGDKADMAEDKRDKTGAGADNKKTGSFGGKSNALGHGGRAAQMKAKGVPGGVIGAIARKEGAAPGGPNYHGGKKVGAGQSTGFTPQGGIGRYKGKVGSGGDAKAEKAKPGAKTVTIKAKQDMDGDYKKVGAGAAGPFGTPTSGPRPGKAARAPKATGATATARGVPSVRPGRPAPPAQNAMAQPGIAGPAPTQAPSARGMLSY